VFVFVFWFFSSADKKGGWRGVTQGEGHGSRFFARPEPECQGERGGWDALRRPATCFFFLPFL